jgi:hypothetical protein
MKISSSFRTGYRRDEKHKKRMAKEVMNLCSVKFSINSKTPHSFEFLDSLMFMCCLMAFYEHKKQTVNEAD